MPLDINTLLAVTVVNIVCMALVAPAVMGPRLGSAARFARLSLITSALSWLCMMASNLWPETWLDHGLSTLSVGGFALTHWLLFRALHHWLGPRPYEKTIAVLALMTPAGYFLLFGDYAWRVGWANGLLALQLTIVSWACFKPATPLKGNWRLVLAFGLAIIAILTLGRGVLGAFTDHYPSFLTPHPWNVAAMLMTNLMPLIVNFALLGGWHEEAEAALHQQAVTDALTGLYNRRGWQEVAQPLAASTQRLSSPLALLMLDIDYFKRINDVHGHEAGDRALKGLGELLNRHRRAGDVSARIGGEEFCLLLPGAAIADGQAIEARIRESLPALAEQLGFPLNFSSGLAIHRSNESLEKTMERADNALYEAKRQGRGHLQVAI